MSRRTKIVCTLGPASSDEMTIKGLIEAGMDVARLNFSHGRHSEHERVIETVRRAAREAGRVVPILQDLQGPKIRVGDMKEEVVLHVGDRVNLTTTPQDFGDQNQIYINYPTLAQDLDIDGNILIDDGQLELKVVEKRDRDVLAEVVEGGTLRSRKGVNLPNIRTTIPALTEKDLDDLEFGLEMGVDFIALSFVRDESDVAQLIARMRTGGSRAGVIAKIEKPEAVDRIDQILAKADGIMVARGDLGIEMRLSKVPGTQKRIIRKCLSAAKPVITATQMLESMIEHYRPTRAEVSDVANAVLDGSDAVMLSGETAVGKHPIRVVEVMSRIITEAERDYAYGQRQKNQAYSTYDITEAVSYAAFELASQVGAVAICCLTASGATARSIARHRPNVPVYAFTDDQRIVGQMALSWGTKGFHIPFQHDTDKGVDCVHEVLLEQHLAQPGDLVIITAGMPLPAKGRTNMMHVSRI